MDSVFHFWIDWLQSRNESLEWMLDYCGEHNIVSEVEVIPISKINEAFERLLKQDVKYRFVIDMSTLG